MKGSIDVPFHTLFADTVSTHGEAWARSYYTKNGMQAWEFAFWMDGYKAGMS